MKNKEKQKKSIAPFIAIFITGIIGAFALGYMVEDLVGEEPPAEPEDKTMELVFQDGSTLGARLKQLEGSINQANSQVFQALKKDMRQMSLNTRIMAINSADMPVQIFDLKNTERLPSKGPEDALITIVEFSDYQCPYCSRMALFLDDLHKKYPDQIRIIFVDRPLTTIHPYAFLAHEATAEAEAQGKFWEMYGYIFKNQQTIFPRGTKDPEQNRKNLETLRDKLVEAAGELDMDKEKMRRSLENHTHKSKVDKNLALATALRVNSTPTIFIDAFFILKDPGAVPEFLDKAVSIK
jgi:protein-disulfide isomerase